MVISMIDEAERRSNKYQDEVQIGPSSTWTDRMKNEVRRPLGKSQALEYTELCDSLTLGDSTTC